MIKLLVRLFIKDCDNVGDRNVRERYGVLGGVRGSAAIWCSFA